MDRLTKRKEFETSVERIGPGKIELEGSASARRADSVARYRALYRWVNPPARSTGKRANGCRESDLHVSRDRVTDGTVQQDSCPLYLHRGSVQGLLGTGSSRPQLSLSISQHAGSRIKSTLRGPAECDIRVLERNLLCAVPLTPAFTLPTPCPLAMRGIGSQPPRFLLLWLRSTLP